MWVGDPSKSLNLNRKSQTYIPTLLPAWFHPVISSFAPVGAWNKAYRLQLTWHRCFRHVQLWCLIVNLHNFLLYIFRWLYRFEPVHRQNYSSNVRTTLTVLLTMFCLVTLFCAFRLFVQKYYIIFVSSFFCFLSVFIFTLNIRNFHLAWFPQTLCL
jgi:hypothetical protein